VAARCRDCLDGLAHHAASDPETDFKSCSGGSAPATAMSSCAISLPSVVSTA
jgi:hypothetical protein